MNETRKEPSMDYETSQQIRTQLQLPGGTPKHRTPFSMRSAAIGAGVMWFVAYVPNFIPFIPFV